MERSVEICPIWNTDRTTDSEIPNISVAVLFKGSVMEAHGIVETLQRLKVAFTANVRFKLRISQNKKLVDKNCPEQFL